MRISKAEYLRLEQIILPGIRIWVLNSKEPHYIMLPDLVFSFSTEEKEKYQNNKFMEDKSDLPTLAKLLERS